MERTEIGIGNMRIDVVDDNAVYINLNGTLTILMTQQVSR
jgi:hypothetical protein